MKRLIEGIVYDTEQAELLGQWDVVSCSIDGVGMPNTLSLYRGKNGHYFKTRIYRGQKKLIWKILTGEWHDSEPYFFAISEAQARAIAFDHGLNLEAFGFKLPEIA